MAELQAAAGAARRIATLPGLVMAAVLIGAVGAPIALMVPLPLLAAGAAATALVVAVALYPPLAAYTLITLTPLLAGLSRSALIPLLRPHEALAVLVGGGLLLNRLGALLSGQVRRPRLRAVDCAIVAMAVTGSVVPLLWLLARGLSPTSDDLLYALTFWKFYIVYLIVRLSVARASEVRRCLWLSMATACIVALVAALQSMQLFGVVDLVARFFPTEDPGGVSLGRGTSTLGSSIAVGDIMAFNLAIAVGWLLKVSRPPRRLLPLAVVFLLGGLASGQFSGAIALAVSVTTVAVLTRRLRRLAVLVVPATLLGAAVLWPVISERLAGFHSTTGLPQSWEVRLVNLSTYFWPELSSHHGWLLGVRPAARILATESWREYLYIESGYTWLLWVGGVPLCAAYLLFVVVGLRQALRSARSRVDAAMVAGLAAATALTCTVVLMALDPHLVMRGTADLLFMLLALSVVSDPAESDQDRLATSARSQR